jgi:predicted alpha/beta hydrolase
MDPAPDHAPAPADFAFAATDGFSLAATYFPAAGEPRAAAIIHSATAVPRKIYKGFAAYLAGRGVAVMTYDYRGTCGSRPASLKGFDTSMAEWAARDVTAAIDFMRARHPDIPQFAIGHSFGGQAIGLVPNNTTISRALLVAAQAGYWRLFHWPENYRVLLMLRLVARPVTRLVGYMPLWLGIGEEIPKGVFLQWTDWVMKPRYFFDDETLTATDNYPRYRGALRALCFSDDSWATLAGVRLLCSGFTGTAPDIVAIAPADIGVERIGHFGFFRPEYRETLWEDAADWLLAG